MRLDTRIFGALVALSLLLLPRLCPAQDNLYAYLLTLPDSSRVRSAFQSSVLTAPPARALGFTAREYQAAGITWRVAVSPEGSDFLVSFTQDRDGARRAGDMVFRREKSRGYIREFRVYLSDDEDHYLAFSPLAANGNKTVMRLNLYELPMEDTLNRPINLLFAVPLSDMLRQASGALALRSLPAPAPGTNQLPLGGQE